jgi:hypothetical protein
MENITDLSEALASGRNYRIDFPGGHFQVVDECRNASLIFAGGSYDTFRPKRFVGSGSFLTDQPPAIDKPFALQQFISTFCGKALVSQIDHAVNSPVRIYFKTCGPVFGDPAIQ